MSIHVKNTSLKPASKVAKLLILEATEPPFNEELPNKFKVEESPIIEAVPRS